MYTYKTTGFTEKQNNVTHNKEEKKSIGTGPNMTQILKLTEKGFNSNKYVK